MEYTYYPGCSIKTSAKGLKERQPRVQLELRRRHTLEVLVNDVGIKTISAKATRSLTGLKIAPYYGGQIVRPDRGLDDKDNPQMMDLLFKALGLAVGRSLKELGPNRALIPFKLKENAAEIAGILQ